jgi:nitroreductase
MHFDKPITELIRERVSTRRYVPAPIDDERRGSLERFLRSISPGPFGTLPRFGLIAASEEDSDVLRGLGTYGFIKGATGYIVGAVGPGEKNLEDFGYLMEAIILHATGLGLGTCWLGGTFTKRRFANRFDLRDGEEIPAITSIGYPAGRAHAPEAPPGQVARTRPRLPWGVLFFDGQFGNPLSEEAAGEYSTALEMVRLGPSASNKQPWRIVRDGGSWHFSIQRSLFYGTRTLGLAGIADMPRLDVGIAMCHFELTARQLGLRGSWRVADPGLEPSGARTEYSATWVSES